MNIFWGQVEHEWPLVGCGINDEAYHTHKATI